MGQKQLQRWHLMMRMEDGDRRNVDVFSHFGWKFCPEGSTVELEKRRGGRCLPISKLRKIHGVKSTVDSCLVRDVNLSSFR